MNIEAPKRPYRQGARAAAAEANADRILDAFGARMTVQWFDEVKLDDVARDAGVTVQTVIRRFGGKEGLVEAYYRRIDSEITMRRHIASGDVSGVIDALIDDYETIGDFVIRSLAQEDRFPAVRLVTDHGRRMHRIWTAEVFAPWLRDRDQAGAERTTDALVVACDIYVWKLLRRDMQRSLADYRNHVERMCAAAVGVSVDRLLRAGSDDEGASGEG